MAVADKLRALQIKVNVIADRQVGLMDIEAEVHNGIAVLTGEVETWQQKQIAEQLAYQVDGVHEVSNQIRVASAPNVMPSGHALGVRAIRTAFNRPTNRPGTEIHRSRTQAARKRAVSGGVHGRADRYGSERPSGKCPRCRLLAGKD